VIQDFQKSDWKSSDIITYSGSGEPTLAVNLGEVAEELSKITSIPQLVLTNGTLLNNPAVIADLQKIDRVYVKLDAATNEMFMRVNRPVDGISLQTIIENVQTFKTNYQGFLGIQIMVMPMNRNEIHQLSSILNDLQPNEVQLNTPTRPYPNYWHIASRGGHAKELRPYEAVPLRTIKKEEAREFETILKQETGLNIISVYQKSSF
jgi:wyosine [tRNA(Phe)-imidazoG37] synthetase (radical SAM superfamily)